jgi:peptide/nickel transport system permease protein
MVIHPNKEENSQVKKVNISLITGLAIFTVLLLLSFFPEAFTYGDPYGREETVFKWSDDNKLQISKPPFKPGVRGPLGTDELGRDIYSQLVFGAAPTMTLVLVAVLIRLLLAFAFGLRAGFGGKVSSWLIQAMNTVFTTIPALIFSIIMLKMPYLRNLPKEYSLVAFACVISVVEWARMGLQIEQHVKEILSQPYIEGAVVIGKSPVQIALQNVVPHLIPYLIVILSLEAARVLFLLCQLGVFGVVVGNLSFDAETLINLGRSVSYEPEWAAMLGTAARRFRTYPWIVFPPMIAFFSGILAFNLIGEGLRIEFAKRNSRFISLLKKVPYILSPRMFIYDMSRLRTKPLPGLLKLGTVITLLFVLFFPRQLFYYPFDADAAFSHTVRLSSPELEGRRTGSAGRDLACSYIASRLESYGLKPGGNAGFIHTFNLDSLAAVSKQEMSITLKSGKSITLKPYEDFRVLNFGSGSYSGRYTCKLRRDESLMFYIEDADNRSRALIRASDQPKNIKVKNEPDWFAIKDIPLIEVKKDMADMLFEQQEVEAVTFHIEAERTPGVEGRNIIAVLPGVDPVVKNEFILVSAPYDGVGDEESIAFPGTVGSASAAGVNLELARALSEKGSFRRTVVFAFWDYSEVSGCGAEAFGYNTPASIDLNQGVFHIDLRHMGLKSSKAVKMDTGRNPPSRPDTQRMSKHLKNSLSELGFNISNTRLMSPEADAMQFRGLNCVVLEGSGAEEVAFTPGDDMDAVSLKSLKDIGQALLNAMQEIAN